MSDDENETAIENARREKIVAASGVARFDGFAIENIQIGARVAVEIDLAIGRLTVRAATP